MYVIFPTHVSTKEPIWFHAFVPSQKKSASLRHVSQHCVLVTTENILIPIIEYRNLSFERKRGLSYDTLKGNYIVFLFAFHLLQRLQH